MNSLLERVLIGGIVGGIFAVISALLQAPKKTDKSLNELMILAKNGDFEECKNLIETSSIDINAQDNKGATALIYATLSTNVPTVKLLLENGADKALSTTKGLTALTTAKNNKMESIIEILS